ncbi:hypothetical protein AXX17_ATUG02790 (mitochondrion) [Arabidopsis thaliana]|uniref:Uncharacterized protein n=1 Tax=Arabidopsis thaliana TaxID=3702 RepID=A0A178U5S0_ARATH|nr:hypothetical protein AXX17_ATUG02790 [Arabidopsis thaliana]
MVPIPTAVLSTNASRAGLTNLTLKVRGPCHSWVLCFSVIDEGARLGLVIPKTN